MGALIGGGIVDLFPRIRAAITETAGSWLPAALDLFDTHYLMSPGHVPNLKRMPRDVIAEGRYFHGIDSWERLRNWARICMRLGAGQPGRNPRYLHSVRRVAPYSGGHLV